MSKLYIIGNGFDLWHGLPTKYTDFYLFAKETFDKLEAYFSGITPNHEGWFDFENALGTYQWEYFYDEYNHIDVTAENFKLSHVYGFEDELSQQADALISEIREKFYDWISKIDVTSPAPKLVFPQSARFLSFNYTLTLQHVYSICDARIFHIHGNVENCSELIFGHGEVMEEEPDFDENGDSNRTMFSDAEGSAKSIFFAFQKQTDEIIKQNRKFFESLRDVMDIETIGHSLNEIDLPYFKEISKYAKGAVWVVYYHKSEEKSKMAEQLLKCGVPPERIKLTPLKP